MTIVIGSLLALLALLAIVALARWKAKRKDAEVLRRGLLVEGQLVGEVELEQFDAAEHRHPRDDEPERATRQFVTVAELQRRILLDESLVAERVRRRQARRVTATEQTAELAELPVCSSRPYPRGRRQ